MLKCEDRPLIPHGHGWWWRQALEQPNLWYHFARFAEAVKDIDPAAERFEPAMVPHDRLRIYLLKGRHTLLAWCRDSQNDWQREPVQGVLPETLTGLEVDLSPFLTATAKTQSRIYDPWRNRWHQTRLIDGHMKLEPFTRSVVIRIDRVE